MKFSKLKSEIIDKKLCSHCGSCVGLSTNKLRFCETDYGPLPCLKKRKQDLELKNFTKNDCPGYGVNYSKLNLDIFNKQPDNWLIGNYINTYIGYSNNKKIRRSGASGGIITQTLIHLLKTKKIDGAVMVKQGTPKPWLANPIIATTRSEIEKCSQSVYAPIPVNKIFNKVQNFKGKLAFVGLPDQVASLRMLQKRIKWLNKIKYIIGPYVGTNMYFSSIENYVKRNKEKIENIKKLEYRAGEWPGHLRIKFKSGQILKMKKFYYNYLIPFYITKASLLSSDLTNEFTDISVGDAWSPKYEKIGKGFSVIIARTIKGQKILQGMKKKKIVNLKKIEEQEAMSMHGHMLDFKKRGSFVRGQFRNLLGKKNPNWGYHLINIPITRIIIEIPIFIIFSIMQTKLSRFLLNIIPKKLAGKTFNFIRKKWKNISKPSKRKTLFSQKIIRY